MNTIETKTAFVNPFTIRKVEKRKSKLRIGMFGTSGSGKTYSSILLANGLTSMEKICIIDTENGSADLYEGLGDYNVLTLKPPFSPEQYISAISAAENAGMEVIIIDSISHEWEGEGGILEIVEKLGGRYQDWGKATPRHTKFIQKMLWSPAHIIATARKKQDYAMTTENGKTKVEKKGLKEITREGFEYEMTLAFDLSQNHLATTSKDRTGMFMDKPEFIVGKDTGKVLKKWSEEGVDFKKFETKVLELLSKKGQLMEHLFIKYRVTGLDQLPVLVIEQIIANLKKLPDAVNVEKVAAEMEQKEAPPAENVSKDVKPVKEEPKKPAAVKAAKKKEEPVDPDKQPAERFMIAYVLHHKDELLSAGIVTKQDIDQVEFMNAGTYRKIFAAHKEKVGSAKK